MADKRVTFYDTTMRDGAQSVWAMRMSYGAHEAVSSELDKAGYNYIELPVNAVHAKMQSVILRSQHIRRHIANIWETKDTKSSG